MWIKPWVMIEAHGVWALGMVLKAFSAAYSADLRWIKGVKRWIRLNLHYIWIVSLSWTLHYFLCWFKAVAGPWQLLLVRLEFGFVLIWALSLWGFIEVSKADLKWFQGFQWTRLDRYTACYHLSIARDWKFSNLTLHQVVWTHLSWVHHEAF